MSIYLNPDAELAAVKALGEDIGFGRIIQLAHQCWDEMLEAKHGIKNHSEGWTLASADLIRERRTLSTRTEAPADAAPQARKSESERKSEGGRCIDTSFGSDRWTCDGEWHRGWIGHDPYAERCPKSEAR